MSTAEDFLMGGGSPSAKFPEIGATITGTIKRIGDPMQQRDMGANAPKFWDNGDPMMQLPVDLATDQRDDTIDADDGTRTIYIKGNMQAAIREAVRKAGAKMLQTGGTLTVTYASNGTAKKAGFNPPKVYEASYAPPSSTAAASFLNGDQPDTTATPPATAGDGQQSPEVQELLAKLAEQGVAVKV